MGREKPVQVFRRVQIIPVGGNGIEIAYRLLAGKVLEMAGGGNVVAGGCIRPGK